MRTLVALALVLFLWSGAEATPPERSRFSVPEATRGESASDVILPADVIARPDETPQQAIARALHGDEAATCKRAEDVLDWRNAPNALNAELAASDAPTGAATFTWSFDARGRGVSCSLDADGDGELDYRLADCRGQTRVTHRFPSQDQGDFFATLLARSEDGRTGVARARVSVR